MAGGKLCRFTSLKTKFPTAHIESCHSAIDAWNYCGKEDTRIEGPVEFGLPPANPSKKGDRAGLNKLLIEKGAE